MSSNEDPNDSSFKFDSFDFTEFDEWQANIVHQNQRVDRMIEDVITSPSLLLLQPIDHNLRARRRNCERDREGGELRLFQDYFSDNPVYLDHVFRRRFRMRKHVFLRIVEALTVSARYFQHRQDATGRFSISSLQKCTAAIRVLAYGTSADAVDEYLRISSAVTRKSLKHFVEGIIAKFGEEYLRPPTTQDRARLLHIGERRGFPGMLGSIDCMHWGWKNCPTAWAGQYAGRSGSPTVILEAVASQDLWIWHAFFGTPGSCNDINVLHRSPIFDDILNGRAPIMDYVVNNHDYSMGYYLTDGIYPSWAAFVKSISSPQLEKHKLFAQHQEAARKDVERAFGVLQARFAFIRHPCLVWDPEFMGKIMSACIIMHNMIVEDERDTYLNYDDPTEFLDDLPTNGQFRGRNGVGEEDETNVQFSTQGTRLAAYMVNRSQLRNRAAHIALRNDLIEHIWAKFGPNNPS